MLIGWYKNRRFLADCTIHTLSCQKKKMDKVRRKDANGMVQDSRFLADCTIHTLSCQKKRWIRIEEKMLLRWYETEGF